METTLPAPLWLALVMVATVALGACDPAKRRSDSLMELKAGLPDTCWVDIRGEHHTRLEVMCGRGEGRAQHPHTLTAKGIVTKRCERIAALGFTEVRIGGELEFWEAEVKPDACPFTLKLGSEAPAP